MSQMGLTPNLSEWALTKEGLEGISHDAAESLREAGDDLLTVVELQVLGSFERIFRARMRLNHFLEFVEVERRT